MNKKILYFVAEADYFCSHRVHIALAAIKASYKVALIARCNTEIQQKLEALGITVFPLKHFKRASLNPWHQIRSLLEIYRIYTSYKPDVVHQVALKPVIFGSWVARICGVPRVINALPGLGYLFTESSQDPNRCRAGIRRSRAGMFGCRAGTETGPYRGIKYFIRKIVLRIFKTIFAMPNSTLILQNRDDQYYLIQEGVLKPERSVIIPGAGVNVDHYSVQPFVKTPPVRIVCISRLLWHKGIGELAIAAKILKAKYADTHNHNTPVGAGLCAGPAPAYAGPAPAYAGPASEGVDPVSFSAEPFIDVVLYGLPDPENPSSIPEATLQDWQQAGLLRWEGHCHNAAKAYAESHIAALPSYREGLPKSLLEAASCGRPIVTTDVPGCREVVRDGDNGFLVPAQDAQALAEALARLIEDPELRTRMGLVGRTRVEQSFSEGLVQAQTLALY